MGCKRYSDVSPETAAAPAAFEPGQFLDAQGAPLSSGELGEKAAASAYVLVGESHPYPCDHLAQARVLEAMSRAGTPPVVGLEMVSLDRQDVLDRFNAGEIGVDGLPEALDWDKTWGHPFEAYRPLFDAARSLGLPLYALNAPRDVVRKAGKVGLKGLSAEERQGLPAKIIPVSEAQKAELREIFNAHPFGKPKDARAAWKSFLTVQALWDTTMAQRATQARRIWDRPVAIMAGGGHVERGWGIAARLAVLDPAGPRLLVMPWRGGGQPDPAEAQVFAYCPEPPRRPRIGVALESVDGGLSVTAVDPGSKAEAAGVRPGDLLLKAQGERLATVKDLHAAAMRALEQGGTLVLEIGRDGGSVEIDIPLVQPQPGQQPGQQPNGQPDGPQDQQQAQPNAPGS
nr:ChaN family lipoprotein [Fundidesulfovibrio agrisoli]